MVLTFLFYSMLSGFLWWLHKGVPLFMKGGKGVIFYGSFWSRGQFFMGEKILQDGTNLLV